MFNFKNDEEKQLPKSFYPETNVDSTGDVCLYFLEPKGSRTPYNMLCYIKPSGDFYMRTENGTVCIGRVEIDESGRFYLNDYE